MIKLPLYIPFILSGLFVTLIAYVNTFVSPDIGRIIYAIPYDLLIVIFMLYFVLVSRSKIVDFVQQSGVYGLIVSVVFLSIFLLLSKDDESNIWMAYSVAVVIWFIICYFLFLR